MILCRTEYIWHFRYVYSTSQVISECLERCIHQPRTQTKENANSKPAHKLCSSDVRWIKLFEQVRILCELQFSYMLASIERRNSIELNCSKTLINLDFFNVENAFRWWSSRWQTVVNMIRISSIQLKWAVSM